jgi:Domain of unknown function (DUF932)
VVAGADALYADQATAVRNAVNAAVEDVNRWDNRARPLEVQHRLDPRERGRDRGEGPARSRPPSPRRRRGLPHWRLGDHQARNGQCRVTNVVCDNTRDLALSEKGQQYKVKHSRHSVARLGEAREAPAIIHTLADEFAAEVAQL